MVLLHDLARLGDPRRASGPLADLCRWVEGPYCPTLADSAAAMAARSAPELEKVAGRFEELGALLLAAESARRAAQAYREAGLPRAASHCDLQAERLADACPGAWSPALAAGAAPVRLTRRENEVAVLAALGATSRDIADRLCVSVRTVENHLQNVYTKLGISGRDQLATALKN
jgi:DNA-binding CsgD family transcriptional regulator